MLMHQLVIRSCCYQFEEGANELLPNITLAHKITKGQTGTMYEVIIRASGSSRRASYFYPLPQQHFLKLADVT